MSINKEQCRNSMICVNCEKGHPGVSEAECMKIPVHPCPVCTKKHAGKNKKECLKEFIEHRDPVLACRHHQSKHEGVSATECRYMEKGDSGVLATLLIPKEVGMVAPQSLAGAVGPGVEPQAGTTLGG